MSRVTLLTGGTDYSSLIKRRLKQSSTAIILLTEPGTEGEPASMTEAAEDNSDSQNLLVTWNKRSSLSARNIILTALNNFDRIDEAVLIYQPGDFFKTFHETSAAVYDLQIDRWIKGYGYLLKEIIQLFIKQNGGTLSLILDMNGMKVMTPLENAIFNYLRSLVKNLSVLYQNEPFRILCFESDTSRKEDFLSFFVKTVEDSKYSPGKIHRFGDKKPLFDFGRN